MRFCELGRWGIVFLIVAVARFGSAAELTGDLYYTAKNGRLARATETIRIDLDQKPCKDFQATHCQIFIERTHRSGKNIRARFQIIDARDREEFILGVTIWVDQKIVGSVGHVLETSSAAQLPARQVQFLPVEFDSQLTSGISWRP